MFSTFPMLICYISICKYHLERVCVCMNACVYALSYLYSGNLISVTTYKNLDIHFPGCVKFLFFRVTLFARKTNSKANRGTPDA